jgi:hypothetical protein
MCDTDDVGCGLELGMNESAAQFPPQRGVGVAEGVPPPTHEREDEHDSQDGESAE